MFGSSWDKVWASLHNSLIFTLSLSLLCFFNNLLKFYSGGAVDLWSCFFINDLVRPLHIQKKSPMQNPRSPKKSPLPPTPIKKVEKWPNTLIQ